MKEKFSKKARRHAAESKARTRRMLKDAGQRSGPVKISYLPGFEPVAPSPEPARTKFPFKATINGSLVLVHGIGEFEEIEYLGEVDPDDEEWWEWDIDT